MLANVPVIYLGAMALKNALMNSALPL